VKLGKEPVLGKDRMEPARLPEFPDFGEKGYMPTKHVNQRYGCTYLSRLSGLGAWWNLGLSTKVRGICCEVSTGVWVNSTRA